ncbi:MULTISPECIES: group III truncated hemoglobin [unclassified Novosphingobium]|uniref:group III truncated hemoglobin n=1 Tax=unclassified Novosphingobium TaxID=2644732 RepID=UPI000ACFDB4A|nr:MULTISPECIES: group III truncated hemoglobin [unclassified Novosphingobium]MBN9145207.1 group III truncated hemoglobin [Novosphingobium sp.]MDR6709585.1 hemoglobin [Novosphingobium sp. 1748]
MTQSAPLHPVQMRHPDLARLVEHFYGQARQDPMLAPVFARITDWPHHFRALSAFWATQLRGRGLYRGVPIAVHHAMKDQLTPAMFDRWLALWDASTAQVMEPQDAAALQAHARRIAAVMQKAMFE